MDEIKRILCDDIERLNRKEKRDNKIRFSTHFIRQHPSLFGGMLLSYVPVALILWFAPYFGQGYVLGFTLLLCVMALALSFNIKPRYRFEDIDQLDLRVCYNGEWYNMRRISPEAMTHLQESAEVPEGIKRGLAHIQQVKGSVTFFDVFSLAYLQPAAAA